MTTVLRSLGLICVALSVLCVIISTAVLHDPLAIGWVRAAVVCALGAVACSLLLPKSS